MHLAIHLGVKKIILVAFDMKDKPQDHWFGNHPEPIQCRAMTHDNRIRNFAALKSVLDERGIEVLNASPRSALTFFRQVPLETALEIRK